LAAGPTALLSACPISGADTTVQPEEPVFIKINYLFIYLFKCTNECEQMGLLGGLMSSVVLLNKNNTRWVDSACHPSKVDKMSNSFLETRGTASAAQPYSQHMMQPAATGCVRNALKRFVVVFQATFLLPLRPPQGYGTAGKDQYDASIGCRWHHLAHSFIAHPENICKSPRH